MSAIKSVKKRKNISTLFRRASKYSYIFQRFFDVDSTLNRRRKAVPAGITLYDIPVVKTGQLSSCQNWTDPAEILWK